MKKKDKKKKGRADRGPFGGGRKVAYDDVNVSDGFSEDQLFRKAPLSQGSRERQLPLQEYAIRKRGALRRVSA